MNSASDILIIGGGIIGLSLAIELRLRGATVTVLCKDFNEAATQAAAGMLAPQAEKIPPSPLLDLCLNSRSLYPEWVQKLEAITGLPTGYWPCGILAPVYQGEMSDPGLNFPEKSETQNPLLQSQWLDKNAIHQQQPELSDQVIGGWWYPKDGQVDNRALFRVLQMAAKELKVSIQIGYAQQIIQHNQQISHLETSIGTLHAKHYILAAGAWSKQLLPIPVSPKKGQMLSLRVPSHFTEQLPLKQVLFGTDIYIIPRQDGQVILGATSEDVDFMPHNTPLGIHRLITNAMHLYPPFKDYPIQEFWWGFRPNTPDEFPILGPSFWENLTLATGHYRNGILLAPITAKLVSNWVEKKDLDPLLAAFHYSRFNNHRQP